MDHIRRFVKSNKWLHIFTSFIYKLIHPKKDIVFTHPTFGSWAAYNLTKGKKQYYPYPEGIFKIAEKPNERIAEKYCKKDFVEVSDGDTVVDIGAFVGEFTLGVAEHAEGVISCEPTPSTVSCLQENTRSYQHITIVPAIIGSDWGLEKLRIAEDPTDNSTLDVDSESRDTGDRIFVPSISVKQLIEQLDLTSIDFLKVEAEGAEPEILSEIEDISVKKIAVDASPERYGESTVDEIKSMLSSAGYEIRVDGDIVFGLDK